jgi:hypothetical protein
MSKRTVFTTITPLPAGITRETVLETLHDHIEMIDLNPFCPFDHFEMITTLELNLTYVMT